MSQPIRHALLALLLAALATAALACGRIESDLARAERDMATLNYARVQDALDRAERFYQRIDWLPVLGPAALREVRARQAALSYWQRDYGAIVPAQADPIGALPPQSFALQFVVANAVFRQGLAQAKTPAARMQAIDAGIAAQLAVLKNSPRNEDAAFNYEYLLRLRAAVALKPNVGQAADQEGSEKTTHGQPGGAPRQSEQSDFKIHIPLESKEFEDQAQGEQAGKAVVRERKG